MMSNLRLLILAATTTVGCGGLVGDSTSMSGNPDIANDASMTGDVADGVRLPPDANAPDVGAAKSDANNSDVILADASLDVPKTEAAIDAADAGVIDAPSETPPTGFYEFCNGSWCRGQCYKMDGGVEECRCFDLAGGCGPTSVCCSASICVASCSWHEAH